MWTVLLVIAFAGPWIFGFAAVNGPGFTQSMVAAGPIYLIQAIFLSFVLVILLVGAIGLVAELVIAPNSTRELRVWQAIAVIACLALAVVAAVWLVLPGLSWVV
jgi:hypothetical protein